MASPIACTIVANNYLAYARVLAASFHERHPDGAMHVLIVDRRHADVDYAAEPFHVTFVEELGIPRWEHMSFRYSILELSTAVKPYFLQFLHERHGAPAALYFDPDILVTGDLGELWESLATHDVVLTPHITAPLEDRATPGERDFLLSGIYNLGFLGIACNARTLPFLDWWQRRLHRECLHAVERGLFVDQRWMDFAPAFLERTAVLRDPGYNAAYWNLAHRRLARDARGSWTVEGRPLRFFHFSGLMAERPEVLSRYQDRFAPGSRPDVEPLFDDYRARLLAAGHRTLARIPYGFGTFDDGDAVPGLARRLLQAADPEGRRWPQPFVTGSGDSFRDWLLEPDDPTADVTLSRISVAVWDERQDLRRVFPSLRGTSRRAYAYWLLGRAELPPRWLAATEESLRPTDGDQRRLDELQRKVWHRLAANGMLPLEHLDGAAMEALAAPVADGDERPRFTRLGLILHRLRSDLQAGYPDPQGADRLAYGLWFATHARLEYWLPWRLVAPVLLSLPPRRAAWALAWWARNLRRLQATRRRAASAARTDGATDHQETAAGSTAAAPIALSSASGHRGVNVVGWVGAPTGVGQAARGTLAALDAAGVPHAVWALDDERQMNARTAPEGAPYDVTLLHVNADMMAVISDRLPRWVTVGRHRVAYWFWELAHFPLAFAPAFEHADEVWAPTRFCLEAFKPLSPVPVRWVPPSVPRPQAAATDRRVLGVASDAFLLLFAFDARSVPERKNPAALLRALRLALPATPQPLHLVIKVNHAEENAALVAELRAESAGLPVTLLTASMARQDVDGLLAACDAFVSLHRSEGLGLPLIEAMMLGKPVLATGYGGCTDFLDERSGWVVRHALVPLRRAFGPYPPGAVWADPDVEHGAEQLLHLLRDPELRRQKCAVAQRRVEELYAPEAAGARLRRELDRILALHGGGAPRRAARPAPVPAAGVSLHA